MKKICFIILYVLVLSQLGNSQKYTPAIQLGLNFGKPNVDYLSYKYKPGLYFSFSENINFSEKLSIAINPNYSLSRSEGNHSNQVKEEITLGYMGIGLNLSYNLIKRINFLLGPQLDYLINSKCIYQNIEIDIDYFIAKKFNLSLTCGLEFLVTDKFGVFFNYRYGLLQLNENLWLSNEFGGPEELMRVTTGGFSLGGFYRFR